ncbi:MAG TPA: rhodanese-like domain-containing protein, partial [Gemmatimonadaceae bacterium]|nr:rhodanese-like domain-containing protein [Gemmatimonadaceae bacterium]
MLVRTTPSSTILPGELQALAATRSDLRLLDVRTPGEFETVRIPASYNVPLDCLGLHAIAIRDGVDTPIVLVCQSGARARQAEAVLAGAGAAAVQVLDGGINAWVSAGGLVRRARERMALERQVRIAAGALVVLGAALALLVHPLFALLPLAVGSGLVFAGVTDRCGLALALTALPYNRPTSIDVNGVVG